MLLVSPRHHPAAVLRVVDDEKTRRVDETNPRGDERKAAVDETKSLDDEKLCPGDEKQNRLTARKDCESITTIGTTIRTDGNNETLSSSTRIIGGRSLRYLKGFAGDSSFRFSRRA